MAVPCSGGGLAAGVATALTALQPDARVFAIEPAGYDDYARSLDAGTIVANVGHPPTLCDALQVQQPGELTFAVNHQRLTGALRVTDAEVMAALGFALRELKLVLEPSGAAGLAALLAGHLPVYPETVTILVLSGGNVDDRTLIDALMQDPAKALPRVNRTRA